jgi:GC-rich sequence DNA-binding factor
VDVLEASYDVMTDTLAEYSNAATVRDRFVKWKTDFPKSYEDAYISLSLHEVFSPFVRLEVRRVCCQAAV